MKVIGIASNLRGTDNQMRGIILHSSRGDAVPCSREKLLTDINGNILHRKQYSSDMMFRRAVFKSLSSSFVEQHRDFPQFVVLPYNQAASAEEGKDVDLLSKYIKEFFQEHNHPIKTIVIASKLYDYQSVDLINAGLHQLSRVDDLLLMKNEDLRKKMVLTEGVPSNLNWTDIEMRSQSAKIASELAPYRNKKVSVFSLGGKTANGAIQFTLEDAETLLRNAEKLQSQGYQVIFTNSPRTPNDVTDYLFENCSNKGFAFYNSKTITDNPKEAEDNFTIYHGKYNQDFKEQAERTGGNIYPAVLSLVRNDGFVLNTWDSFSYTSDAAALGITSVVYNGNTIDTNQRSDCKKLFETCLDKGYIIKLEDFIDNPRKTKPMVQVNEVICKAMDNALTSVGRQNFKIATGDGITGY